MANLGIRGFIPAYGWPGGGACPEVRVQAKSAPTPNIFIGDVVCPADTGLWDIAAGGTAALSVGSICTGAQYVNAQGKTVRERYLPAATSYTATEGGEGANFLFVVDPSVLGSVVFEATISDDDTPLVIANASLNINFNFYAGTGSTANGTSGHYLISDSAAITATLQFRFMGFVQNPRNDRTLVNPRVYCMVNAGGVTPALSLTGI